MRADVTQDDVRGALAALGVDPGEIDLVAASAIAGSVVAALAEYAPLVEEEGA